MLTDERRDRLIRQYDDTWNYREWDGLVDPDEEPVVIHVSVTVPQVLRIDAVARERGKTREELVGEAIDAPLAMA